MASPTWWTWVWACSGSWWWTGSLVCCSPWGCKESDMTEGLNWTDTSVDYLSNTHTCVLSCFSCVHLIATPWTVSCQAPLLCPPLGDLPDPGIEVASPAFPSLQVDSLLLSHQRSSSNTYHPPQWDYKAHQDFCSHCVSITQSNVWYIVGVTYIKERVHYS